MNTSVHQREIPPFSTRCPSPVSTFLICLLALTGIGCATDATYRAEDDGVFAPSFRLVAEASPGRQRAGAGDPGLGEEVRAGYLHTLEAEVSSVVGEDRGSSDQSIDLNGTVFAPNTELDGRFQLNHFSAHSTSGFRTETGLEFSLLYGVEYTVLDLKVDGGGLSASTEEKELGLSFGARLRWLINEDFRLYAMARSSSLAYTLQQSEIGLEYRVIPRLALFAGWRRSDYDLEFSNNSDLDLRWKGLLAGVQLEF